MGSNKFYYLECFLKNWKFTLFEARCWPIPPTDSVNFVLYLSVKNEEENLL